jgi:hypothetical protein
MEQEELPPSSVRSLLAPSRARRMPPSSATRPSKTRTWKHACDEESGDWCVWVPEFSSSPDLWVLLIFPDTD